MLENRRNFHSELDAIRDEIVRLAAMVSESIPRGTEVLLTGDMQGAQALIDSDDDTDALALEIEERCYQVLALQQPMASDLRGIVTAIRLVAEIERSGDLMVNVAKGARRLYGVTFEPLLRGLIEQMSEEALRLFKLSIDSYAEGNAGLAAALDDIDDRLDELHIDYIEAIFDCHHRGGLELEAGVQLALVGRYYERIGDHAVNIGGRVRYMVTGWLPEHTGAARVQARSRPEGADGEADVETEAGVDVPGDPAAEVDGRAGLRLAAPPAADA